MYLGRRAEKEQQAQADGVESLSSSRLASLAEAIQPSEEDPVSATALSEGRDPTASEPPADIQTAEDGQKVRDDASASQMCATVSMLACTIVCVLHDRMSTGTCIACGAVPQTGP